MTGGAQERVAANTFDNRFPDVDIVTGDVVQAGDGFGLTGAAERVVQRTQAAKQIDPEFPGLTIGPGDVRMRDSGSFGLSRGAQREVAADRFEEQTPLDTISPDEVVIDDGEATLTDELIKEIGAGQLDEQLPDVNVTPGDVELVDGEDGPEVVFPGVNQ